MNAKVKVLVGVLILEILVILGWWAWQNRIIGICSAETPQFCDRRCISDKDCKYECGCGCISRIQICFSNLVCQRHPCSECYCKEGKCESWLSVFERALKERNPFLCAEIKRKTCRDICYFELASKTMDIFLCEKISNEILRKFCFQKLVPVSS